jgi:spore coat polysaccharide biosynthesis protein SpsF
MSVDNIGSKDSYLVAIIQARMTSSRLPGKVLKLILGKPMLLHQIERLQHSQMIDKLIVAISIEESDDGIEQMCLDNNIEVFRGDLDNVLDRFYQCAKPHHPEHIVRLTGDCPLADWEVVDQIIQYHLDGGHDYTSNCVPPTYPDGLDVEVMKFLALREAWECAKLPSELEHVTPYIRNNPELFSTCNFEFEIDLSAYRWTVDEPNDFEFVKEIYAELYLTNQQFKMKDILDLLEEFPHLKEINHHIVRNEGALKSYEKDKDFLKNEL